MKGKKIIIRLVDAIIWALSLVISVLITKNDILVGNYLYFVIALSVIIHLIVFEIAGLYRCIWRYLSVKMLIKGAVCDFVSIVILMSGLFFANLYARRILLIAFCVEFVVWTMSRLSYVALRQLLTMKQNKNEKTVDKKRLMIIGAGSAGRILLDEIYETSSNYLPVCILDDSRDKKGRFLRGVPIVGKTSHIREYIKKYKVDIVILAIYNISDKKKKDIINTCVDINIPLKILPHYADFMKNKGQNINNIRNVSIEDLLFRKRAHIDNLKLTEFLENKVVMVTGGGGSIGGELCRQIAKYNPEKIVIVDICENGAYDVNQDIRRAGYDRVVIEIVSVTDFDQMNRIFNKHKPDIVYHAAAHKHVPLMEDCRIEAIRNNVFGTRNIVELADKYEVSKFILVSTDKAVNPTNIMGATKRLCELIAGAKNGESKTNYISVRFGNVLGSSGSVIPLFKRQIENGGPVTVTSEKCIRYFMMIPEAVELLLTAGSMADGGETFVLDMGEPVKIIDLAKNLIRLSGLVPDKDIKIDIVGMRPGEKMFEELLIDMDKVSKTCADKVFVEKQGNIDIQKLYEGLEVLRKFTIAQDEENMMATFKQLVPTYVEDMR